MQATPVESVLIMGTKRPSKQVWARMLLLLTLAPWSQEVVATEPLPGLAKAAAQVRPGTWYEIPNSSMRSVLIARDDPRIQGRPQHVLYGWNGAAFDGRRFYFHGGGHRGYSGNEVYAFDLATLTWERLTEPSVNPDGRQKGDCPYPEPLDARGNPTVPRSVHTYDGFVWTPLTKTLFRFGGVDWCALGMAYGNDTWEFDPGIRAWTQHADTPAKRGFAMRTAIDPATGRIIVLGPRFAYEYDPLTDSISRQSPPITGPKFGTMEIDPDRRLAVILDDGGIRTLALDGASLAPAVKVDLHGDLPAMGENGRWSPLLGAAGLAYSTRQRVWVLWPGGSGRSEQDGDARHIYIVNLDTREIVLYPNSDGPGPRPARDMPTKNQSNGVYSKFIYVPEHDVFVGYNGVDDGVWVYRLPEKLKAASATTPPARTAGIADSDARSVAEAAAPATTKKRRNGSAEDSVIPDASARTATAVDLSGVIRVCPKADSVEGCQYNDLAKALKRAHPGETILLAAGEYRQPVTIDVPRLNIIGEPGARFTGTAKGGKAFFVIKAEGVSIAGIECSDVRVPDGNGACIRLQASNLTVRESYFHDNEMHILGGTPGGRVLIENNRFGSTLPGPRNHGVYISKGVAELIFRGNFMLGAGHSGHDIKCGASRCVIEDNVIAGLEAPNGRALDFMCGGDIVVRHNVIEKGPRSENRDIVGLAGEFSKEQCTAPVHQALFEGNRFIFDVPEGEPGQLVKRSNLPGPVTLRDNVFVAMTKGVGTDSKEQDMEWTDGGGNRFFDNRIAAGLPPFPALPSLE